MTLIVKAMDINHVHFYVEDAEAWRDWLVHTLGFRAIASRSGRHTRIEIARSGAICFVISSALTRYSPVAHYLRLHPPGVADLAFRVTAIESIVNQATCAGAKLLQPIRVEKQPQGYLKWAQISGWDALKHTLVEQTGERATIPLPAELEADSDLSGLIDLRESTRREETESERHSCGVAFQGIDHVVLNVAAGDLEQAVAWYERSLGFKARQTFAIQTERSALSSRVLAHPNGAALLPINEPASASSQIQEFLDVNQGSGIQHIALQTINLVQAIAHLRQRGLPFLQVPSTYYEQLKQRPGFQLSEVDWRAIARQQVLIDWQEGKPEAMLLQAFTQPIFGKPTFFFELIERQTYWSDRQYRQAEGFGEGNFQALFEAIEREQVKRGSLR